MLLSEINIKEIKPGLEVISAIGTHGKVTKCVEEDDNKNKEMQERVRFDTVFIDWANGKKSIVFHMQCDAIQVKD